MRLIGSLTEHHIRKELIASNAALRAGGDSALSAALLCYGATPATAMVLDWIPEQSEDIYTVLDGFHRVLTIELPRGESDMPPSVTAIPFDTFRESIAKGARRDRLIFAVACALLQEISEIGA